MDALEPAVAAAAARAAAIAELSLSLAELTSDTGRLQELIVRRIGELVGDAAALWTKDEDGALELAAFHHHDDDVRRHMVELSRVATHSTEQGVLPLAWDAPGPVVLAGDVLSGFLPMMQPAYRDYVAAHGMVSLVVVPLRVRGATVALLGVSRDREPVHAAQDVAFLQQVGAVSAVALDDNRLLQSLHRQVAEQRQLRDSAQRAALHDPLTGLPNRRLLVERLHDITVGEDGAAALLLVDVDGFKAVNDFYGHTVGDGVLVEIAARLAEAVLESEAPAGTPLVRLGGDEFAVLLAGPGSAGRSEAVARALLEALEPPLMALDQRTSLAASVGIATGRTEHAEELLHRADIAMYRAKRTGAGWAVYEAELDAPARTRLRDIGQLQTALQRGELVVHYQPVVAREPGAALRLEALVRWQHPDRGLLLPVDFLPLAQSTGLMSELTRQVLDRAMSDVGRWTAAGHDVQVSVNVTADSVAVPGLADDLLRRLSVHGLQPSALCVELTESELLVPTAASSLQSLRRAGIVVAVDDFGTGYSSLAYLADLPLDLVKLDQSFVRRINGHGRANTLVTGLVDFVHDLGFDVVAEGVERPRQSELLHRLGVEWQQGFLFSRPLSADDALRWLTAQARREAAADPE